MVSLVDLGRGKEERTSVFFTSSGGEGEGWVSKKLGSSKDSKSTSSSLVVPAVLSVETRGAVKSDSIPDLEPRRIARDPRRWWHAEGYSQSLSHPRLFFSRSSSVRPPRLLRHRETSSQPM